MHMGMWAFKTEMSYDTTQHANSSRCPSCNYMQEGNLKLARQAFAAAQPWCNTFNHIYTQGTCYEEDPFCAIRELVVNAVETGAKDVHINGYMNTKVPLGIKQSPL